MKRIAQNDLQSLYAPAPQTLYADVHRALTFADERKEKEIVKKKIPLALIMAAVLALASVTAWAAGGSRLLEALFPAGNVPETAASLLNTEEFAASENGVTLRVTETLFDGSALLIQAEIVNDTDETLYAAIHCSAVDRLPVSGTPAEILAKGGEADTLFDDGSFFNQVRPGQTIAGKVQCDFSMDSLPDGEVPTVALEAHVMRALEPVEPLVGGLYAYDALTEPAGEVAAAIPLTIPVRKPAVQGSEPSVCLAENEFRMAGYTLRITELTLAAASTRLAFEIIPDDPEDTVLVRDGQCGRLVRSYVLLNEEGQTIPMRMEGWAEDGVLYCVGEGSPFTERPRTLSLVPVCQERPIMDEACILCLAAE